MLPELHTEATGSGAPCSRLAAVLVVAALAAASVRPGVTLQPEEVLVPGELDALLTSLRDRMTDSPDVLAGNEQRVVRRFSGKAGRFRYATVELVQFERDAVTFEHLRGPFAACSERFELTAAVGGVRLRHSGTFTMKGGLWTWPFARTIVRRSFQDHVRGHLVALRGAGR